MLAHSMNIAGLERKLPICRVTDDLYIGAFVIFGDCELTTAAAKALLEKAPEYDYIITAESKGIPLAQENTVTDTLSKPAAPAATSFKVPSPPQA